MTTKDAIQSFAESVFGCHVIEDDSLDTTYIFVNRGGTACNVYMLADYGEVEFKEIDYFSTSEDWGKGDTWAFRQRCEEWYKEQTQYCPHCSEYSVDFERGVCNECDAVTFCPHCQADLQVEWFADCDNDGLLDAVFNDNSSLKLGCCGEQIWIDDKSNFLIDGTKYPLGYIKLWQEAVDVGTVKHPEGFTTYAEVVPAIGEFCEALEEAERE